MPKLDYWSRWWTFCILGKRGTSSFVRNGSSVRQQIVGPEKGFNMVWPTLTIYHGRPFELLKSVLDQLHLSPAVDVKQDLFFFRIQITKNHFCFRWNSNLKSFKFNWTLLLLFNPFVWKKIKTFHSQQMVGNYALILLTFHSPLYYHHHYYCHHYPS